METTLLNSQQHQIECLQVVNDIIQNLDDKGINELMQGSSGDIDNIIKELMRDTYNVMFTGESYIDFSPKYTDRLSEIVEDRYRCWNLNYFITSVMPDFQISWHHLE